ncbi:MAG: MBL fold metallo-hydrolase [Collinsella sp.]
MSCLHLHILGSGSKGNCALIEGPRGLIMIDDGLSRRETLKRMAELGLSADNVSALLITHEHSDHIKGLDVWCNHWHGPLFAIRGTLSSKENLSHLPVEEFDPGDTLSIAGIQVQTYSTSHDVINPVGYRFDTLDDSIGFATDTGELSSQAMNTLEDCRVLALESNHDVTMLREGEYPRFLQERILSARAPLQWPAAEAARELVTERTEQLIAMHISQDNNRPSLTVKSYAKALTATLDDEVGSSATLLQGSRKLSIRPASQHRPVTIQ